MKYVIKFALVAMALMLGIKAWGQQAATSVSPRPYSVENHELKVELDLEKNYIVASDRLSLKREIKKPAALDLLLRKGLKVNAVQFGEEKLGFQIISEIDPYFYESAVDSEDVGYYNRAQAVRISLSKEAAKQKELLLEISYEGVIKDSSGGADFSREYVTDQITGIIDYRGIYLGAEAIFYPALPGQLFTYSLRVTVPERLRCITEGALQETSVKEGKRTEHWVCVHPMDAFHIVGGQYQVHTVEHNGVQISTYFFPEQVDLSNRYLDACKEYIDLYSELLGPYPFEKFAVVDNFFASGYGMPSFTLLGSQVLRLPWIISTSLGHEICHNWWGNSVYVNYESGNWCEGLTTYCADYLYKERESVDAARDYRIGILRDYTAYTHEGNDFPLAQFRERHNPSQRAIGYGKSAMVFHMLRKYVGEDDFWRSLKRFYRDNVWSHASWDDIRKAFEKESAMKLGWFFDQWIQRSGAPLLDVEAAQKQTVENAWEFSFTLKQVQEGEAYILDVPIIAYCEGQKAHMQTGINQKVQSVKLRTIFEPISLSVDPNFDIFRRLKPTEVAPTLAGVLGNPKLIIVLPGLASPELEDAYQAAAKELMPRGTTQTRIISDHQLVGEDLQNSAIIFLGTPAENQAIPADWIKNDRWRIQPDSYWLLGQDYSDSRNAFLAIERHPDNPEISIGFFCARSAMDVLEVSRKLKHYGKYSYLIFQAGKNVAKGNWEVTESPMTLEFK